MTRFVPFSRRSARLTRYVVASIRYEVDRIGENQRSQRTRQVRRCGQSVPALLGRSIRRVPSSTMLSRAAMAPTS